MISRDWRQNSKFTTQGIPYSPGTSRRKSSATPSPLRTSLHVEISTHLSVDKPETRGHANQLQKRTKRRLKRKGLCPLIGRCSQLSLISTPSRFLSSMHFVLRPVAKLQLVPLCLGNAKLHSSVISVGQVAFLSFSWRELSCSQTADHGRTAYVEVLEDDMDTRVRI
jgi:hypothetical protein